MISSLLLWLLLCVLWPLCCGQNCSNAEHAPGSFCHLSMPCRAEHPSEEVECVPYLHSPFPYPSRSLPDGITRCPRSNGLIQNCPRSFDGNETLLSDNRIASAFVDLNAIDYTRFAINISWDHLFNPTGGYEVRVRDNYRLLDCYCIENPDNRSLYLDDQIAYPPFTYRTGNSGVINVGVRVLSDLPAASLGVHVATEWPRSCLDITHTSSTCGLPVYNSPSNVAVYKSSGRSGNSGDVFNIHWQYGTAFVMPTLFYVAIYSANEYRTFVVNNTNSIEVSHVSPLTQYHVQVQSYVHCSGLANRTYSLGCGQWSKPVKPVSQLPLPQSSRRRPATRRPRTK